jgi:hypothetical protein
MLTRHCCRGCQAEPTPAHTTPAALLLLLLLLLLPKEDGFERAAAAAMSVAKTAATCVGRCSVDPDCSLCCWWKGAAAPDGLMVVGPAVLLLLLLLASSCRIPESKAPAGVSLELPVLLLVVVDSLMGFDMAAPWLVLNFGQA